MNRSLYVLLLLSSITLFSTAQTGGILKSTVLESGSNAPIEFANVLVEGTTLGGVTDEKVKLKKDIFYRNLQC
ncbi:MAG: hypothetical protein IPH78_13080 [Bacteroidetes bacterium]|nr:hypothetical protein [Bacteroidota bacterium]